MEVVTLMPVAIRSKRQAGCTRDVLTLDSYFSIRVSAGVCSLSAELLCTTPLALASIKPWAFERMRSNLEDTNTSITRRTQLAVAGQLHITPGLYLASS